MRAVLQRVKSASVSIGGELTSAIGNGWLVLLGLGKDETPKDTQFLIDKILNLRAFSDEDGKFSFSVSDIKGEILVVSQFTLFGDCTKGRRPGFSEAAPVDIAAVLYKDFMTALRSATALVVKEGVFQASMQVSLCNDGPVTLILDSKKS